MWGIEILAVLLLLLFAPIHIYGAGPKNLELRLRYLFFTFPILPFTGKKKKRKKKPGKKKAPAEEDTGKEKKKTWSFTELLPLLKPLAESGAWFLRRILRRLRIHRLELGLRISRGDAYETAMAYGRTNAAVYTLYGLLQKLFTVRQAEIQIEPDFMNRGGAIWFALEICVSPATLLAATVGTAFFFLPRFLKGIRQKKEDTGSKEPVQEEQAAES